MKQTWENEIWAITDEAGNLIDGAGTTEEVEKIAREVILKVASSEYERGKEEIIGVLEVMAENCESVALLSEGTTQQNLINNVIRPIGNYVKKVRSTKEV